MYPQQGPITYVKPDEIGFTQAVTSNNIARCKDLISSNKECVHEKGWNQLIPLHNACLSGKLEIVKLLVENGSDPNARSGFDETPLHYACRRGSLPIVHYLLKNGGDHNAKDKRGRTCMHFAATGGSVAMLHYLSQYTDLKYDTPDFTGKNILSICCEHRHMVAASYLLRNDRVDPQLSDLNGVTPLHIAAEKGYGELAWIIMMVGGCGLLHIQNKKSHTPRHIAKDGKTENHKQLFALMKHYSQQDPKLPPRGPVFRWYFQLLFPFFFAALVFLLTTVTNGHSSYFSFFMFSFLVIYVIRQSHRIKHVSRWPNPVFAGAFIGGILHCSIAHVVKVVPALWPCPLIIIWTLALFAACGYLLWFMLTSDPGIDKNPKFSQELGRPLSVLDVAEERCRELDFCVFTEKIYGDRTKYCRICEKPMLDMDHHCLFLYNCVAKNNHRQFILLLLVVMLLQFSFICFTIVNLLNVLPNVDIYDDGLGDPFTPYAFHLFYLEPWLFHLMIICLFSMIWESTLVCAQLSVIMRKNTTYFASKKPYYPRRPMSQKEMLNNVISFFLRTDESDKLPFETKSKADVV